MSLRTKTALFAPVLLLLASLPVAMQLKTETGSIYGVVSDDHGPIAKASVQARELMSGKITSAETNSAGEYKLVGLQYGRYSLWVQAPAHSSVWVLKVVVEKGETVRQDVHLDREPTTTSSLPASPDSLRQLMEFSYSLFLKER